VWLNLDVKRKNIPLRFCIRYITLQVCVRSNITNTMQLQPPLWLPFIQRYNLNLSIYKLCASHHHLHHPVRLRNLILQEIVVAPRNIHLKVECLVKIN
jgi:hypothetical protein